MSSSPKTSLGETVCEVEPEASEKEGLWRYGSAPWPESAVVVVGGGLW